MKMLQNRVVAFSLIIFLLGAGVSIGFCADKININTATEQQLETLQGIGPVLAKRVVVFRKEHPFKKIEDLMQVKGVGEKIFDKIKARITI